MRTVLVLCMCTLMAACSSMDRRSSDRSVQDDARARYEAREGTTPAQDVTAVIREWPSAQRQVAEEMVRKYGPPREVTDHRLVWDDNGPFTMTVLKRASVEHSWPTQHRDFLEQTVFMNVPPDKFDDIARFDGSVILDRTAGTATARCGGEPMNILALNLTHDIATGKKSAEEAKRVYEQTAKDPQGSELTRRLMFTPAGGSTPASRQQKSRQEARTTQR